MRGYVQNTLHTHVECDTVNTPLPLYLRGLYTLEKWVIFGIPFIMATSQENLAVKTMSKHRDVLEKALASPIAFAMNGATRYRIERMLQEGLPFVVKDSQIYLPFLGIAIEERKKRANPRPAMAVDKLSPQAQRLALAMLYSDFNGVSVSQAADLLGVTKMTSSRAYKELESINPLLVITEGRRRILQPGNDKAALWNQLQPHLSTPVLREYYLEYIPHLGLPLSGISALCDYSMLQDNTYPTLAATTVQERALGLSSSNRSSTPDDPVDAACKVQILRYELTPITGQAIDPLSAILSISDEEKEDPRIVGAIEDVLTGVFGDKYEGNRSV